MTITICTCPNCQELELRSNLFHLIRSSVFITVSAHNTMIDVINTITLHAILLGRTKFGGGGYTNGMIRCHLLNMNLMTVLDD